MKQLPWIRGALRAVTREVRWFGVNDPVPPVHDGVGERALGPTGAITAMALALLLLVGDFLFWQRALGISLVVFAWAVFLTSAIGKPRARRSRPFALMLLASLPVIEYLQFLSAAILFTGLCLSVAWLEVPRGASMRGLALLSWKICRSMPTKALRDLLVGGEHMRGVAKGLSIRGLVRAWALPVGGGFILFSLLAEANPVLAEWLRAISRFQPDLEQGILRALLWIGLAMVIWPFLSVPKFDLAQPLADQRSNVWAWLGLNPASVGRALVAFNLLVGVQTLLDAVVLLGGGGLPDGVTYSEYARQGAFPLLAITLFGGAFALATRQILQERKGLRPLLYLWLCQNVLICGGALHRLALYVDAYGLTYLRLHSLIWIPLVAIGLVLTAWQVHKGHPNTWLLLRAGLVAGGVVYAACFVNFAAVIARHNLGDGLPIDWYYLVEELPSNALPAIREEALALGCPDLICDMAAAAHREIPDWRAWGFRRFRTDRNMEALDLLESKP